VRRAFDIEFRAAGIDPTMRFAIFSRSAAVQASNSACRFNRRCARSGDPPATANFVHRWVIRLTPIRVDDRTESGVGHANVSWDLS
jgi:hypothetical protein